MIANVEGISKELLRHYDRLSALRDNISACADAADKSGAFILPINEFGKELEWLEWFRREIADGLKAQNR